MASHPSRRGSNFCRFLASDVEKITIFWESILCEIIAFFRTRQTWPCASQNSKKSYFFGEFSRMYFSSYFLFLVIFLHCAFWVVHDVRLGARKNVIFSDAEKKWHFFGDVFSRETIRCFLAPALSLRRWIPYLSANRLKPRISRNQHIQTCHFKTTNVKIHPVVPKVYTHLISFGQMKMANPNGNFGNALVGLRAWNNTIHDFRRSNFFGPKKKTRFFGRLKKCCFFGPWLPDDCPKKTLLCGWLAIWLAALAGYLAIGFVAAWLAIWLLAIWLAGWLADWHWLSGWLYDWLALWLAIWLSKWLVGHLAGWLSGRLMVVACALAGWLCGGLLASWLAHDLCGGLLASWLAHDLAIWLSGWLPAWLSGWLAIWLAGSLSG